MLADEGTNPGEGTPSRVPDLHSQLDEIVRRAEIEKNTHHPFPGARPMPLSLVRDLQFPPLGPGDFENLPDAPGTYEVVTVSGSRHIISRTRGRITWQRHPGEWSGISPFDEDTVIVHHLDCQWALGKRGTLTLDDETYAITATTIHVANIIRIHQLDTPEAPSE